MSFKGQGQERTRILQIIIWEKKKKVSWFDDEDVYVAAAGSGKFRENEFVQNNKVRDYLFHISDRYIV